MRVTTGALWVWLLEYITHSAVTGAAPPLRRSQIDEAGALSSLDKILVFNGYDCPPHSQPWQAALLKGNHISCGGALVHPQWVLSAAHCLNTFDTIGLGLYNIKSTSEPGRQVFRPIVSVPHPNFRMSGVYAHDIMLIKLSKPAVLSETVKTISIASNCSAAGTTCLLSGWGLLSNGMYADILQCLETRVVSRETCGAAFPVFDVYEMFCTVAGENKAARRGDSGSPVVCNGELQGIHVAGHYQLPNNPDIHTSVCKYKNWIERTILIRDST